MDSPFFFIAGAAKAGTTSLCEYLSLHPDICISDPKETNFFDTNQYEKGVAFYKQRYFSHMTGGQICGEGTPNYLHVPYVADRIKNMFPDAKLVVILRNPVERCFSHWWMFYSRNREKLGFEDAIQDNLRRIQAGIDFEGPEGKLRWNELIDNILCYEKGIAKYRTYLDQGYYDEQLERYLRYFSADRLHCIFFEDFSRDLHAVLRNICGFLGINVDYQFPDLMVHNVAFNSKFIRTMLSGVSRTGAKQVYNMFFPAKTRNRILSHLSRIGRKPEMSEDMKRRLIDHYSDHNRRLEKLTGKDLSHWDK